MAGECLYGLVMSMTKRPLHGYSTRAWAILPRKGRPSKKGTLSRTRLSAWPSPPYARTQADTTRDAGLMNRGAWDDKRVEEIETLDARRGSPVGTAPIPERRHMERSWTKRPRWPSEGQDVFSGITTAFTERLPAAMPRQALVGYHRHRPDAVLVVEVLACGHEGQHREAALIEQWIAEGKTRPCPQCPPVPSGCTLT